MLRLPLLFTAVLFVSTLGFAQGVGAPPAEVPIGGTLTIENTGTCAEAVTATIAGVTAFVAVLAPGQSTLITIPHDRSLVGQSVTVSQVNCGGVATTSTTIIVADLDIL